MKRICFTFSVVILCCVSLLTFAASAKTIHLLMEAVPDTFYIQNLLPEFEKETGIKVEFEIVNYAQMHGKLLPQLLSPKGVYDAIVVDNYWAGEFPAAGWLERLEPYVERTPGIRLEDYLPSMLDMVGYYEGKLYMIPFYNYTMILIYRNDLLTQAGAVIPDTVEEYVDLCSRMAQDIDGDGEVDIYGTSMMGLKPDPICMEWSNYLFSCGGDYYDENWHAIINNPEAVKATRLYAKNMHLNAPMGAPGFGFDEAINVVAQGKAFSLVTFWMFFTTLNDPSESQVAGKVLFQAMPGGVNLNGGWGWAIPKSSPDKEAAWKFISWVESSEIAIKRALQGGAPTRRDAFQAPEVVEKFAYYPLIMKGLEKAKHVPEFLYSTEMIEVVGRELSLIVEGKDAQKALDEAAGELNKLAKKAKLYR